MYNRTPANNATAQRRKQLAADRKVIVESGLFDANYYLETYPDVASAQIDPLDHYVEWGGKEGRRPNPRFDPILYAIQNPDVLGSGIHPLVHYWTKGRMTDISLGTSPRLLALVDSVLNEAGTIEPTILESLKLSDTSQLAINSGAIRWPGLHAWRSLFDSLEHAPEHIIFVPGASEKADKAAANATRATIEIKGRESTLVVVTDREQLESLDPFPKGAYIRVLSQFDNDLTSADRALIVENLILATVPKTVLNIGSTACWDAVLRKGAALRKMTDLHAYLGCGDCDTDTQTERFVDARFLDSLLHLHAVYVENSCVKEALALNARIPLKLRERLVTLRQPLGNPGITLHRGGPSDRNKIVWAQSYWTSSDIGLLLGIVTNAPDLLFDVFGHGDIAFTKTMNEVSRKHPNLTLKGPFSSTTQLQLDNYNAFLYTSSRDGLSPMLVEVASTGIPVVASAVCGVADLVKPSTGWLVGDFQNPLSHVHALRQISNNSNLIHSKSKAMLQWINMEYSWEQFLNSLRGPSSFIR